MIKELNMGITTDSKPIYKCVLVIDNTQPTGIIANIASILSITLGKKACDIVGHDVLDKQGEIHSGITRCPIPILGASPETIKEVRERLRSFDAKDMVLVDFSTVAQQAKIYEEYEQGMRETDEADLCYMGIGIYAEKRIINKATGNLSLIR